MRLNKYLSNMFGWSTKRKIVVIESDDWGSIYMSDRASYEKLRSAGYAFQGNHFLKYDSLESNDDVSMLSDVLSEFTDSTGRPPVITTVSVVANPNYEAIESCNYRKYEYEPTTITYSRFPNRDKVQNLLLSAQRERLMVPVFHGREHLNVKRWMNLLNQHNDTIKELFKYRISCVDYTKNGIKLPDLRAAFAIDLESDIECQREIISSGIELFRDQFKRTPTFAILTNGVYNNKIEGHLVDSGIKYLGVSKIQLEDFGGGKYKRRFHYLGMRSRSGLVYLTRNCFFEPCLQSSNYVDRCLNEIDIAFRCRKPAIISSHRVNYSGEIFAENRTNGLKELSKLLSSIIHKWPDVEFMTSEELGDLMSK